MSARRRKQELERLNEQLRTINTQLRQQARAGTLYAPGLTYAPTNVAAPFPGTFGGNGAAAAAAELAARVAAAVPVAPPAEPAAAAASGTPAVSLMSQDDEEAGPEAAQCTQVGWGGAAHRWWPEMKGLDGGGRGPSAYHSPGAAAGICLPQHSSRPQTGSLLLNLRWYA